MTKSAHWIVAAMFGLALHGPSVSAHSAPRAALATTVDDLAWMAGDWETAGGETQIEEHWTLPSGHTMLGMSRSVRGGRTVAFEFIRLEERADGVYYVAQPQGRPPVGFRLSTLNGMEVSFGNPDKPDHLTKILYRRDGDGLAARIEGSDGTNSFAEDFHYRRGR